ncbi:MAG: hypothetical protein QXP77_00385 [Candidatus Aenigmatarchaeota archaeon]
MKKPMILRKEKLKYARVKERNASISIKPRIKMKISPSSKDGIEIIPFIKQKIPRYRRKGEFKGKIIIPPASISIKPRIAKIIK